MLDISSTSRLRCVKSKKVRRGGRKGESNLFAFFRHKWLRSHVVCMNRSQQQDDKIREKVSNIERTKRAKEVDPAPSEIRLPGSFDTINKITNIIGRLSTDEIR